MMRNCVFVLCLLFIADLNGQASLTVDRMQATIGDQLKATIKTNTNKESEWINVNEIWPDSTKQFEVIAGPEITHDDPSSTSATWTIALFDTGWVRIPSLTLLIKNTAGIDSVRTNDVPIQVKPVEPDSTGLLPIKPIYKQPFSLIYYKKYIPHLIGLALLLFSLIYWWRHRKKKEIPKEVMVVEPLPHEWAFKALSDLEAQRLWQSGDIKEHYSLLTAILREYLERRYGIRALEQTSDEILDQLRSLQLTPGLLDDTQQLLSVSDLIKFAKADPGIDIHAATIERVRHFVKLTMQVPALIIPSPDKENTHAPVE
jgi:hypothetical protein